METKIYTVQLPSVFTVDVEAASTDEAIRRASEFQAHAIRNGGYHPCPDSSGWLTIIDGQPIITDEYEVDE